MTPSNKELGDELVKDANALVRLFCKEYAASAFYDRLKEAARRLQMSAGLRSVRAMKEAAIKATEGGSNISEISDCIRRRIENIPLPLEEPGEFRSLGPEVRRLIFNLIDSLDYVNKNFPQTGGSFVRDERIATAQKFLAEHLSTE